MNKYLAITAFLALVLVVPTAYAETDVKPPKPPHPDGMMMPKDMKMASSTGMMEKKGDKKEKPEGRRAIPGIVTRVSSTGFTMTGRGPGKGHATTTLTVVVTPTTIFKVRNMMISMGMPQMVEGSSTPTASTTQPATGPTTGSLSDIIVGTKVEVFGKVSTSTNTITADRVHINRGKGEGRGDDKMEHRRDGMASGTPSLEEKKGFLKKFRDFMMGGGAGANGSTTGGPAGTGFIEFLSNVFASWFK